MVGEGETLLWRQCVALAGALGEAGVQEVSLTGPDGTVGVLVARATDLPGALSRAPIGALLEVRRFCLAVVRDADRLRVARADGPVAVGIKELLAVR